MTAQENEALAYDVPAAGQTQEAGDRPFMWRTILICGFCLLLDTGEIAIGQSMGAIFRASPTAYGDFEIAWLLASVYVGGMAGAAACGWLADRFGRRNALVAMLILLAIASIGAAASGSLRSVAAFRVLAGISLAGIPPVVFAYLTEALPSRLSARGSLAAASIGCLGPSLMLFSIRWLTPLEPLSMDAWRFMLVVAALLGFGCALAMARLPESAAWRHAPVRASRKPGAEKPLQPSIGPTGIAGVPVARRFVLFSLLFFLSPWATIALPLLSGAVVLKMGFGLEDTLLILAISSIGPIAAPLLTSLIVDRFERVHILSGGAALLAILGFTFTSAHGAPAVMASLLGFTLVSSVYVWLLNIYCSESFPSIVRGRAAAGSWTFNRLAAVLSPFVLLPMMHDHGIMAVGTAVALALGGSILLLLRFGPRARHGPGALKGRSDGNGSAGHRNR